MVREARNHRSDHHTSGHSGLAEGVNRLKTKLGLRRPRLHSARQVVIQGGNGNKHSGRLIPRKLRQEVKVPGDQMVLGDDHHGVPEIYQHLEAASCQL